MVFTLTIKMDNSAFCGIGDGKRDGSELARILKRLAAEIGDAELTEGDDWQLYDLNGNRVGKAEVE